MANELERPKLDQIYPVLSHFILIYTQLLQFLNLLNTYKLSMFINVLL